MLVNKSDLDRFGLYETLPDNFKKISGEETFIFIHDYDEVLNKLIIVNDFIFVTAVNVSIYKNLVDEMRKYRNPNLRVGWLGSSIETRDGIVYQLLRTFNAEDKVTAFYQWAVEQDNGINYNIETNTLADINGRTDFLSIIGFYSPTRIQLIMLFYDFVNKAFQSRISVSLYEKIKKVVTLIKFQGGGVLPEWTDSNIRMMVIGEKAKLSAIQTERLNEAKLMLRSLNKIEDIFKKTGWAVGDDGKWRTNIADDEAVISDKWLVPLQNRMLYVPMGSKPEEACRAIAAPSTIFQSGYNGILSDVLEHPTLFHYYPHLLLMPLLYFVGDKPDSITPQEYYQSDTGYINIVGSGHAAGHISVVLHETQHAIQGFEGMAKGGNEFFAKFVASVGSEAVRKIFCSVKYMERKFREKLLNETSRNEILAIVNRNPFRYAPDIRYQLESLSSFKRFLSEINFSTIVELSRLDSVSNSEFGEYLIDKLGDSFYNTIGLVGKAVDEAQEIEKKLLISYHREVAKTILFTAYETLYGEYEARSTQHSRMIPMEWKNYFYLSGWEHNIESSTTVIDGLETFIDISNIVAAVEEKKGEYVFHFTKNRSVEPFIHELAHCVHDGMKECGYEPKIEAIWLKKQTGFTDLDLDEWFVDKWIGWLTTIVSDVQFETDLPNAWLSVEDEMNTLFEEWFRDADTDKMLLFLKEILEIENIKMVASED